MISRGSCQPQPFCLYSVNLLGCCIPSAETLNPPFPGEAHSYLLNHPFPLQPQWFVHRSCRRASSGPAFPSFLLPACLCWKHRSENKYFILCFYSFSVCSSFNSTKSEEGNSCSIYVTHCNDWKKKKIKCFALNLKVFFPIKIIFG